MTKTEAQKARELAEELGVEFDTGEARHLGWWFAVGEKSRTYSFESAVDQITGDDQ